MNTRTLRLTEVTNMKKGMEFVKTAVLQLVDMEDVTAGVKIDNMLSFQNLQRYTTCHPYAMTPIIDFATIAGDMFSALVFLSQEVEDLQNNLSPRDRDKDPVKHSTSALEKRVVALEENLRSLKESLTYQSSKSSTSSSTSASACVSPVNSIEDIEIIEK